VPLPNSVSRIDDPVPLGNGIAALVSTAHGPSTICSIAPDGTMRRLSPASASEIDPGFISSGETISIKRDDGVDVHAIYYPPTSATHAGPAESTPPLLVLAHGGPTSRANRGLAMRVQYYTSRGFAVADVDYAGSVGYGRAYQQRLDEQWGIADVADCAAVAKALAAQGKVDAQRMAIAGGSAGGYTVLMAMATSDVFAAGSCHYGISDMALLLAHTHKFESGYLHRLMGTTPDDWEATFAARSPLTLVDRVKNPIIFFQGLDDKVVPPEQTRVMLERLEARKIDAEAHEFAGEGHGFRKSETIIAVLEAELAFLARVMKLDASGTAPAAKKNRRGASSGGSKS
jgi:dipeptidyl aminopeptidase/acylaminoacyl peptidase